VGEAAELVSQGLEQIIRYIKISEDEAGRLMRGEGMSDAVVQDFLEMDRALSSGLLVPAEARTSKTSTPTTLEQFARETIAPLLHVPAST
jgi:hypothetical protein